MSSSTSTTRRTVGVATALLTLTATLAVDYGVIAVTVGDSGAAGIDANDISCERKTYVFRRDGTPADFLAVFRDFYGPTMNAFEAAAKEGRAGALRDELVALFQGQNQSQYPNTCLIPATFLRVTVEVG